MCYNQFSTCVTKEDPHPPLPDALELIQLLSPSVASSVQLAQPIIIMGPRFFINLPLSSCSCIITMSTLGC